MPRKADYVVGSGNVFADLGLPNAEEMLAKAELAQKITRILARRRLTQVEAPTQPMRSEAASADSIQRRGESSIPGCNCSRLRSCLPARSWIFRERT